VAFGATRVSANKSADLKALLGVTSAAAPAAPTPSDASAGLKAMLGVAVPPPPMSTPDDASSGLKAMLGVQPSAPPQHSMPMPPMYHMHQPMHPGYNMPMPPPPMAMGFQSSQPMNPAASNSSAAEKLLQMMQSGGKANQFMASPIPAPSGFNFTYVEEGKEAPPQHQQPQPQTMFFQPPPMMMTPPSPMPMMGMHMPPPMPPPPQFTPPDDDFPALGAQKVPSTKEASTPPVSKRASQPSQPIVPSVILSKNK